MQQVQFNFLLNQGKEVSRDFFIEVTGPYDMAN